MGVILVSRSLVVQNTAFSRRSVTTDVYLALFSGVSTGLTATDPVSPSIAGAVTAFLSPVLFYGAAAFAS